MNKRNWLIVGVVVLVIVGVWFYFDSREEVGLDPGSCSTVNGCSCGSNVGRCGGHNTAKCYSYNLMVMGGKTICTKTICTDSVGDEGEATCSCKTAKVDSSECKIAPLSQ